MNRIIHSDWLIVGAGPAGLFLGIELRRQGVNVEIIEAQSTFGRNICGEYLTPAGVKILKDRDLANAIDGFLPLHGMVMVSPAGRKVQAPFPESAWGVSLNRKAFSERLLKVYQSLGGLIHFSTCLEDVTVKRKHSINNENSFHQVFCSQEQGGLQFQCRYLVGADGRKSKLGSLLGLPTLSNNVKRVAVHCYLKPKTTFDRYGEMHILKDGSYVGINPINEFEINFSIVTDSENLKSGGGAKNYIQNLIESHPDFKKRLEWSDSVQVKTTYPITRRLDQPLKYLRNVPDIAFVGDASGFIDPLTGEGITMAFKSVIGLMSQLNQTDGFYQAAVHRKKDFLLKEKMNRSLQWVIRHPLVCEWIAKILARTDKLKSSFIGVVGNVYSVPEGIQKLWQK